MPNTLERILYIAFAHRLYRWFDRVVEGGGGGQGREAGGIGAGGDVGGLKT